MLKKIYSIFLLKCSPFLLLSSSDHFLSTLASLSTSVFLKASDLESYYHYIIQMVKKIEGCQTRQKKSNICTVCMEKEARVNINCSHKFCMNCITRWSYRSNTCPLCRGEYTDLKYGKKTKKAPTPYRLELEAEIPRQRPQVQLNWKPMYWVRVFYPVNYYLYQNFYVGNA